MTDEKEEDIKLNKGGKKILYGTLLAALTAIIMYMLVAYPLHFFMGIPAIKAHNFGVFAGSAIFIVVLVFKALKQHWVAILMGKKEVVVVDEKKL